MYFNRINEQLLMFLLNVFRSQSEKEDQLLVAKHRWKTDFICLTLSSVQFSSVQFQSRSPCNENENDS